MDYFYSPEDTFQKISYLALKNKFRGIYSPKDALLMSFKSQFGDSKDSIKGKTLSSTSVTNMLIPILPIEEQQRIVERLNVLLPICDTLTE